jgi:hypothetical protein
VTSKAVPILFARVCDTCVRNVEADTAELVLISKSKAKEMFLLTDRDLQHVASVSVASPWPMGASSSSQTAVQLSVAASRPSVCAISAITHTR